jgi:signal transduction histidine kinase
LLCGVFRAFRRIAANRNDGNNASTSARIRQAAWTGAALVVPVALSVALLPLRAHVDDVLVAVVLLAVSATVLAAREKALREQTERNAAELAERQRQVERLAADLTASRRRIVAAGDEMRRRIERNLHDGVQQRLVTVSLRLGLSAIGPAKSAAA